VDDIGSPLLVTVYGLGYPWSIPFNFIYSLLIKKKKAPENVNYAFGYLLSKHPYVFKCTCENFSWIFVVYPLPSTSMFLIVSTWKALCHVLILFLKVIPITQINSIHAHLHTLFCLSFNSKRKNWMCENWSRKIYV